MIHNDVLNQLQFLIKTAAPPLLEVQTRPADLPVWTPGQKLPAYVLSQQPNGRFAVLVQEHVLDMNLPRNTQPGQNLELTFVANQPRLTFVLSSQIAQQLPQQQAGGRVSLSEAAKYLGGLLQKLAQGQVDESGRSARTAPLLAGAPTDAKALAVALKSALSQSGLFYESHQAQWVAGERPLASLLQEPQGQLSRLVQQQGPQQGPQGEAARVASVATEAQPMPRAEKAAGTNELVHPQTQNILQQQLTAIDSRQVVWQGQVWPGQDMKWEVEEREARNPEAESEAAPWQTRLSLNLPGLGEVIAVVALQGQDIRVQFHVARPETAELMKREQVRLHDNLQARGLSMQAMTVDRVEGDGKAA